MSRDVGLMKISSATSFAQFRPKSCLGFAQGLRWLGLWVAMLGSSSAGAVESLIYGIGWGRIPVARAVLELDDGVMRLNIQTSGVANWLYPVNHDLSSRFDPETGRPLKFTQRSTEGRGGKHSRDIRTEYLWEEGQTRGFQHGDEPMEPIGLEPDMFDPLTMLLSFRERSLVPGEVIGLKVSDGRHVRNYSVMVGEVEQVSTPAGDILAHRLTPATEELGGVYRESSNPTLIIWVTEEAPHIPVRFESQVRVGSFVAGLEEPTSMHSWLPRESTPTRRRGR